jgi:hypothetical protein
MLFYFAVLCGFATWRELILLKTTFHAKARRRKEPQRRIIAALGLYNYPCFLDNARVPSIRSPLKNLKYNSAGSL